jgi:hypothetical protein
MSVAIINFVARFIMFLVLYVIVRKMAMVEIPWKNVSRYVLAAAVMGGTLYLIPHPTRASFTLAETVLGAAIYLAVLMSIDKGARRLPREMLKEIRQRRGGSQTKTNLGSSHT